MKTYWKIALSYLSTGFVWIIASDVVALHFAPDGRTLATVGLIKGWVFVVLSAALILHLAKQAFTQLEAAHAEKLRVYEQVIDGVHHIMDNYLNQMQLVTLEAERIAEFDPTILTMSKEITERTASELKLLGELQAVSAEGIRSTVYRELMTHEA